MKNTGKRVLSIILTCLVILSVMPMAFSVGAAEKTVVTGRGETYNHYPEVRVKGFGASSVKIYYEDEFGSWLLINKLNYSNFHWPRQIQTGSYDASDLKLLLKGLKIMEERQKEIGY